MRKVFLLSFSLLVLLLASCSSSASTKKNDSKKSFNEEKLEEKKVITENLKAKEKVQTLSFLEKEGLLFLKGETKPYTGKYNSYYEDGKNRDEFSYKNGILEGKAIGWYKNGEKRQEVIFKNGKYNSKFIIWYENGQKKEEISYKNGVLEGNAIIWYPNGVKSQEIFHKNGKRNGKARKWDKTGKLTAEDTFKDNVQIATLEQELEILKTDPENKNALFNLVLLSFNSGKYKDSIKYSKILKLLTPEDWILREKLIQSYSALNNLKMLNKEILELRNLRKSQKFPALNKKEVFIREMFMVKNTRVVVAEYFETNSKQSPIWLFALRKDKKDLEHWISLDICKVTSIDLKTMKELEGNKVVYHLHKNYRSQKGEMLYIFYKKPSYNEVKKELINILN